jgi:hypothetical protein
MSCGISRSPRGPRRGVAFTDVAETIGRHLGVPVTIIGADDATRPPLRMGSAG